MLLNNILPLVLTIIIEGLAAYFLGYKKRSQILAITAINAMTNPLINIIYQSYFYNSFPALLVLELAVVLVEWALLIFVWRSREFKKLFFLFLAINASSFFIGLILVYFSIV